MSSNCLSQPFGAVINWLRKVALKKSNCDFSELNSSRLSSRIGHFCIFTLEKILLEGQSNHISDLVTQSKSWLSCPFSSRKVLPYSFRNAVHSQLNYLRSPSELCTMYDFLKNSVVLEFISQ